LSELDLEAVRFKAGLRFPYLASVLWRLRPVVKKGLGTFGVDAQWRLYYDDEVPWTFEECVGVLVHEINHLLRNHHGRDPSVGGNIWNVAGDCEINDDLSEIVALPAEGVLPSKFGFKDGLLAEEYYELLLKDAQKIPMAGTGDTASGNCGTCASNQGKDGMDGLDQNGNPVSGTGAQEQDSIRQHVAQEIMTEAAKNRGTVPAGLVAWADEFLHPTVPWQKVLARSVKHAVTIVSGGATDYSMSRPNRRNDGEIILPSMITHKPEVAIIFDTSGSVSNDEYQQMIGETLGILKVHTSKITMLWVDAAVSRIESIASRSQAPRLLERSGYGGTDMRVGFDAAVKLRPRPNIIICFTDGETPWPDTEIPKCRVIVGLTQDIEGVPEWMTVVRIGDS
jgi:predicted metal-dependent peptidase